MLWISFSSTVCGVQVPREECHEVPREECHLVPREFSTFYTAKECGNLNKDICRLVPRFLLKILNPILLF